MTATAGADRLLAPTPAPRAPSITIYNNHVEIDVDVDGHGACQGASGGPP
ncbi:hypothetical protein [Cellulomonas xiejunii]|nr:hypothetical protein [Cellulomonas xiejunii]MCC2313557.1 hypothetical protein [Cellulomonas xiejunii]